MNSTPIAVILAVLCRHSSVGSILDLLLDLSPEISDTTAHMKSAQVHHPNSPAGASLQPESRLTPAGCGIRERSNEFAPTSWDKEVIIISSKRPRLGLGDRQTDSLPSVPADLQHHFQEPIKGSMHSFLTAAFNDPAIIHQPRMVKKIRSDCNDRAAYPLIEQDCAVDVVPNEIGPNFAVPHVMYDPKEFRLDWDDFQDNEHQQKILQEWQGNPSNLQTTGYDLVDQHRTGQNPHGFYEGRSQSFRNKTKGECKNIDLLLTSGLMLSPVIHDEKFKVTDILREQVPVNYSPV